MTSEAPPPRKGGTIGIISVDRMPARSGYTKLPDLIGHVIAMAPTTGFEVWESKEENQHGREWSGHTAQIVVLDAQEPELVGELRVSHARLVPVLTDLWRSAASSGRRVAVIGRLERPDGKALELVECSTAEKMLVTAVTPALAELLGHDRVEIVRDIEVPSDWPELPAHTADAAADAPPAADPGDQAPDTDIPF